MAEVKSGHSRTVRQRQLVQQIETIVFNEGFEGLTIADLTRRLNCSRRAIYELADSKDELITDIIEENYRRRRDATLSQIYAKQSPTERLGVLFTTMRERTQANEDKFVQQLFNSPLTRPVSQRHAQAMLKMLEDIVRDGVSRGEFRDINPTVVATLALAMYNALSAPGFVEQLPYGYSRAFAEGVELFLNGLLIHK